MKLRVLTLFASLAIASTMADRSASAEENCGPYESNVNASLDFSCESEQVASECKKWFQDNPETLQFARDCKDSTDRGGFDKPFVYACIAKFGEAWADELNGLNKMSTDAGLASRKAIIAGTKALVDGIRRAPGFMQRCDDSDDPKKASAADPGFSKAELAKEALLLCPDHKGGFAYCTDLTRYTCGDLLDKREQALHQFRTDDNYRKFLKANQIELPSTLSYLEEYNKDTKGQELPDGTNASIPWDFLLAALKQRVSDIGVKLECYNRISRAHMICHSAGEILDPTVAATIGLTAPLWAAKVLGVAAKTGRLVMGAAKGAAKLTDAATGALKGAGAARAVRAVARTEAVAEGAGAAPSATAPEATQKVATTGAKDAATAGAAKEAGTEAAETLKDIAEASALSDNADGEDELLVYIAKQADPAKARGEVLAAGKDLNVEQKAILGDKLDIAISEVEDVEKNPAFKEIIAGATDDERPDLIAAIVRTKRLTQLTDEALAQQMKLGSCEWRPPGA